MCVCVFVCACVCVCVRVRVHVRVRVRVGAGGWLDGLRVTIEKCTPGPEQKAPPWGQR